MTRFSPKKKLKATYIVKDIFNRESHTQHTSLCDTHFDVASFENALMLDGIDSTRLNEGVRIPTPVGSRRSSSSVETVQEQRKWVKQQMDLARTTHRETHEARSFNDNKTVKLADTMSKLQQHFVTKLKMTVE